MCTTCNKAKTQCAKTLHQPREVLKPTLARLTPLAAPRAITHAFTYIMRTCAPASHEAVVTAPCPVNTHIGSALITETASVKRSLDAASRSRLPFLLHCPGLGRMHEETTHQASAINAVVTALSGKLCKDTRDAHN